MPGDVLDDWDWNSFIVILLHQLQQVVTKGLKHHADVRSVWTRVFKPIVQDTTALDIERISTTHIAEQLDLVSSCIRILRCTFLNLNPRNQNGGPTGGNRPSSQAVDPFPCLEPTTPLRNAPIPISATQRNGHLDNVLQCKPDDSLLQTNTHSPFPSKPSMQTFLVSR